MVRQTRRGLICGAAGSLAVELVQRRTYQDITGLLLEGSIDDMEDRRMGTAISP